jgi:hypothetical protein
MCSQAGYGLMIAKNSELPLLNGDDDAWNKALKRIAELSVMMADRQISECKNKRKQKNAHTG